MGLFVNTIARRPNNKFNYPKTPVDLTADFANDWNAWNTYQTAAGKLVTLTVPAGTYVVGTSTTDWAHSHPGATIQGAGPSNTTITTGRGFANNSVAGVRGNGLSYNNLGETVEPRIATVSSGSTSVTLLDVTKSFPFYPGRAVMIVGFDVQGFGQPINNDVFEFNRVTSVSSTGVIGLATPLVNAYKQTWPVLGTGTQFEPDPMGSAGILAMHENWDADYELKDLTVDVNAGGLIQGSAGRSILFENVVFATDQVIPSVNESFIMRSCEIRGFVEVDKLCDLVWYDDCISTGFVQVQSGSINLLKITDSTFTELQGTGKTTQISNSVFNNIQLGPTAYGTGGAVTMDNVVATEDHTGYLRNAAYSSTTWTIDTAAGTITMASTKATGSDALIDLTPNQYIIPVRTGGNSCGPVFQVTDCERVGSNFVYQISGLPDPCPHIAAQWFRLYVHPCYSLTVTNTNSGAFKELSTANGSGRPWGAYYYRESSDVTYIASSPCVQGLGPSSRRFGYLEQIRVNVITPYTGTAPTLTITPFANATGQFCDIVHEDGTFDSTTLKVVVNLKVAGERVLTSGTITGTQAGDTLSTWTGSREWLSEHGVHTGALNTAISSESPSVWPVYTVELICNHDLWP